MNWARPCNVADPSTTTEPSIADRAQPLSSTPMKDDDVPAWGQDSPQICDVIGGAAAAFCETIWSNSSSLCQQLHLTATGPRPDLLARLAELDKKRGAVMFGATSPAEVAARRARALLGRCVRVASAPRRVLLRVLSLFHLPLYEDEEDTSQQLLTLLMVNLGRMVYPPVTVSRQTAIFATRDDLLRYESASQLERQLRTAMETKQWDAAYETYQAAETMLASLKEAPELAEHDASLPPFLRRFTAGSIITYVMSKSVEPDHLPSVEIEARCLPRDVPGLKMVFLRPEQPSGGADVTGYVTSGDVTVCSVEELALSHYSSRYSEGVHREGAPTVTLFALLFWDLLYSAEVPDSFRSAYQTLPLDLNSPAFLERRREAVEARLVELEAGSDEDCLSARGGGVGGAPRVSVTGLLGCVQRL
ncbi:Fanconi-associated nuclease 1 [Amphibalanus amphitrite]|uniref:Fanconi-associated nuclease n=1 Tax=Amphibalanus amphitrite TaxID=1232801 RepID=A0A6A4VA31_AMPAM|nr:Fanconi-associated nuclease 1 [Amphibalanus amphitrite]